MNIINPASVLMLSKEPEEAEKFNKWIEQEDICPFLEKEIQDEHIILYASLHCTFINSVLIPSTKFTKRKIQDLLNWDISNDSQWSEVYSSDKVWLEPPLSSSNSKLISKGEQIIFSRQFDGAISNRNYYELAQKLTQILEIHFVPERDAWCKLNRFGDIQDVVKITKVDSTHRWDSGTIISIRRTAL